MIHEIQKKLKAPKGQYNQFGKYKYRSCEDILEAIKPLLQPDWFLTLNDEILNIGDRFYVKATATLSNGEKSYEASALAREALNKKGMDEAQVTGSASSYARKYALNGLFCIDDERDPDTKDNTQQNNVTIGPSQILEQKKKIIWGIVASLTDGFKDQESLVDIYAYLEVENGQKIKGEKDEKILQRWINNLKKYQEVYSDNK